MSENKLYKDIVLEVDIDAKKGAKNQGKETKATFYSYDINSGIVKMNITKDGQPLMLPNGSEVLINVVKLGLPQQKLVFTGDIVEATNGTVYWNIPEQLRGYKGKIRAGVFINLPNGQRLHGGYFKFNMGISEIDTNIEELEEDHWQGWDEFQSEAEAEWSDWKAIRDDTWKKQEKDYDEWKKDQEEKQNNFENDYAEHWDNWKTQQRNKQNEFEKDYDTWKSTQESKQSDFENERAQHWENFKTKQRDKQNEIEKSFDNWESTQEDKQSTFEKDFSDWEAKQKKAQEDFEDNTNNTIKSIDDVLDSTDKKVNDVNNKINNLDVYTKNEVDEKLDNKTSKKDFDNFTEHGFLSVESGFENADGDNVSTSMQYMRVGNLINIFGAVANQKVLNEDSDHLVAKLPERLKVFINDTRVCQASGNDLFTARINESESENYPNQIFIYRFRGGNGISKDFSANRWLNISLTCGVEVVD